MLKTQECRMLLSQGIGDYASKHVAELPHQHGFSQPPEMQMHLEWDQHRCVCPDMPIRA